MSGKKRSTAAKTGRKINRKKEVETMNFIYSEIAIIFIFVISVLLFLSNFGVCGAAGDVLKSVMLGTFGYMGYVFPAVLFIGTAFGISNKGNTMVSLKILFLWLAFICISAFIHIFAGDVYEGFKSIPALYAAKNAGGVTGGLLAGMLGGFLGRLGAGIVFAALIILCIAIISEKSFVGFVKKRTDTAYRHAREDIERRREEYAERAVERRRIREERRAGGIDLAATDLGVNPDKALKEEEENLARAVANLAAMGIVAGDASKSSSAGVESVFASDNPAKDFTTPEEAVSRADIFTGNIVKPYDYNEDSVPFEEDPLDTDTIERARDILARKKDIDIEGYSGGAHASGDAAAETGTYSSDRLNSHTGNSAVARSISFQDDDEGFEAEYDTESPGELSIDEGEKRVVTASGKVIDTDTEALKKKLEAARKETPLGEVKEEMAEEELKKPKKPYVFPPTYLLERGRKPAGAFSDAEFKETAIKLQQTLHNFGVEVTVTNISCGPVVTRYELHPEQGVKVSKIVALADDIKLSLAASDIRIEAPIPGKSAVGIEVPNKENNIVYLRELLESEEFKNSKYRLGFAVGKDIGGQPVVTDIAKMPHLLIAGATGSGKSVCINTLIMSMIYRYSPDDVKMIMIDPKVVELSIYNGIPHLLIPVVTDPKKAAGALNWAVAEMTDRYKKFAKTGVRDLKGYNERIDKAAAAGTEGLPEKLSQIVIIIDELADLMMVAQNEVEDAICRLAQLARACGIHLVIATQRPSVNVITGLIKANIPSRIAFAVSSGVDSRTILDGVGAEKLLGKGDMLFSPQGSPKPQRVQGAFVSDNEVQAVVDFIANQGIEPEYDISTVEKIEAGGSEQQAQDGADRRDDLFIQAGRFIIEKDKASIGNLQRVFKIGFNRAARIMDQLSEAGVVGEEQGTKPRQILMTAEEFEKYFTA